MHKKLIRSLLFFLMTYMTCTSLSYAAEPETVQYENPETGYVVVVEDDAQLLTEEEVDTVASVMEEVTEFGNAVLKTIDDNGSSAESYAREYYGSLFGSDSGALFLIDMDNRMLWLHCDGAVYRTITKAYANTITDNVYRYASDGNYTECASKVFAQITSLLKGQKIAQPMKYICNFLLAVSLALLINFWLVHVLTEVRPVSQNKLLRSAKKSFSYTKPIATFVNKRKVYSPIESGDSGSSGDSGGGGGYSGGGGSSGGSSGGGGGHSF